MDTQRGKIHFDTISLAASRREAPALIATTARSRRSADRAKGIPCSSSGSRAPIQIREVLEKSYSTEAAATPL